MKIAIIGKTLDSNNNESTRGFCRKILHYCESYCGKEHVRYIEVPDPPIGRRLVNLCFGQGYAECDSVTKQINELMEQQWDLVIFMLSLYGSYVKKVSEKYKTLVFFQNVESHYYFDKYNLNRNFANYANWKFMEKNERLTAKFATFIHALNQRDAKEIEEKYNRNVDLLLPVSFSGVERDYINSKIMPEEKYLLFIGSNFYANNEGIERFILNVLPEIDIKLKVVGTCCEYLKEKSYITEKVELMGFVDDMEEVICSASAVVCPIYSGSGMKTKTIEALKYGKTIFGTAEAFMGIDGDLDLIGAECNTDAEFIRIINNYLAGDINKFNIYSYNLFSEKYQDSVVKNHFINYLANNG